jgi:4-hydroxythreonine-4-phosphate dehydrogenase
MSSPAGTTIRRKLQPGKITAEAGQGSFASLKRAVEDLKEGKIQALVTGPINKDNIQSEDFKFPGHTEFLAEAFDKEEALMFMVAGDLRVGVLTGHIPLENVRSRSRQKSSRPRLSRSYNH